MTTTRPVTPGIGIGAVGIASLALADALHPAG